MPAIYRRIVALPPPKPLDPPAAHAQINDFAVHDFATPPGDAASRLRIGAKLHPDEFLEQWAVMNNANINRIRPASPLQTGLVQPWVQSEGSFLASATPFNVRIFHASLIA